MNCASAVEYVCPKCGAPDSVVACDNPECPGTSVPKSSAESSVKPPMVDETASPMPAYECPHCGKDISNNFGAISAHVMCCEGLYREAK